MKNTCAGIVGALLVFWVVMMGVASRQLCVQTRCFYLSPPANPPDSYAPPPAAHLLH